MENKKLKDEELFDDCPICRLMKLTKEQGREPTPSELKEAFKKAKEKGAIVGGEWFKEDKKSSKFRPLGRSQTGEANN